MSKEATQLLEELAAKLGTTIEYLWNVLVRQATIDAIIKIIFVAIITICGIILYRYHIKFSKRDENGHNTYNSGCYDSGEDLSMTMILAAIIWGIAFVIACSTIPGIITGFLNPEYFALQHILSLIK